jgi:hypothetical protein
VGSIGFFDFFFYFCNLCFVFGAACLKLIGLVLDGILNGGYSRDVRLCH